MKRLGANKKLYVKSELVDIKYLSDIQFKLKKTN